jgi:magnesium transporter
MERWELSFSEINQALQARQFLRVKELLSAMEAPDTADLMREVPPPERVLLFRLLPKDTAIDVFEMMEKQTREELLEHFTDNEVAEIIESMSDDDRTELLDELPAKTVKKLLRHLSPEERKLAFTLLNYKEDTAGRVMTPEYIDLKVGMTAGKALENIRRQARTKETIYTSFVVDSQRKLMGVVELEDLVLAGRKTSVGDIMNDDPVYVYTDTDQEEVARVLSRYDFHALPVVDLEKRLVGIITWDDVLDIMEEEATEDIERMAGIQPTDESYLETGFFTLARKRFSWLFICILTEALTSTVLKHNSGAIERVVALSYFIPLLIGTGGNAGTQSSTLMIRGMTLGQIEGKHMFRIFSREFFMSLVLGGALAALGAGRAFMLGTGWDVAFTVACSILAVVTLGNLSGVCLPVVARLFRMDPAVMCGPFITTIVDVGGLLLYFAIAAAVLGL